MANRVVVLRDTSTDPDTEFSVKYVDNNDGTHSLSTALEGGLGEGGSVTVVTPDGDSAMDEENNAVKTTPASLHPDFDQPSIGTRNIGGAKMGGVAAAAEAALISAAGTNATSVTTVATTLYGAQLYNTSTADIWLKLYDKASAPTVGTDVPAKIICIPAPETAGKGAGNNPTFCAQGVAFGLGIAYALTTGPLLADVTGVGAGDAIVNLDFDDVPAA